uniref:GH3 family domain-containing protein n=1 Tax=Streptomyces melanogenes TaxID=67326 RepID=UPI00167DF686
LSNTAGERLRDAHVLRALTTALAGGGLELRNTACRVVHAHQGTPSYQFALASATPWSGDETDAFLPRLDRALARESPGYQRARAQHRLGAPTALPLHPDAFLDDWHAAVATGVRPTQVKDRLFRQDPALWQRLTDGNGS